jgi:hypothetical protein
MKKIILFVALLLIGFYIKAQSPQAIPYQAIVRNASGNIISNQAVKLRFSIHDSLATGTVVYKEIHTLSTNAQGLVNVNIGQGSVQTGSFTSINWGKNGKFIQTELDALNNNTYTDLGTTQMMSVPYALYAESSGNSNTSFNSSNSLNDGGIIKYFIDSSVQIHIVPSGKVWRINNFSEVESGITSYLKIGKRIDSLIDFEYSNVMKKKNEVWLSENDIIRVAANSGNKLFLSITEYPIFQYNVKTFYGGTIYPKIIQQATSYVSVPFVVPNGKTWKCIHYFDTDNTGLPKYGLDINNLFSIGLNPSSNLAQLDGGIYFISNSVIQFSANNNLNKYFLSVFEF